MPAQTRKRRSGLKGKSPRAALPEPGIGGYDYPRGPYGKTGFPRPTPASARTHSQGRDGRIDRAPQNQPIGGEPHSDPQGPQREDYDLPPPRPGGDPPQPRAPHMGGTPAPYPAGYDGNEHVRGGRYTGQRYFGAIADQQKIGLDSDAYGIARRRGPRHRPVRFEVPTPHAANFYDVAPDQGTEAPDM